MVDEVSRHQKNYRQLLTALSRPGRLVRLDVVGWPLPMAAAMAVGECLLDPEVSLCVIGSGDIKAWQSALVTTTRVRLASLAEADFVFICGGQSLGDARLAKRGSLENPQDGATLVYCLDVTDQTNPERLRIRLNGPGIAGQTGIAPAMGGISADELRLLMEINDDYPLGVDSFFIRNNGELMGLPRSTHICMR